MFHTLLEVLPETHGKSVADEIRGRLDGELGESLRLGTILQGGWYPVSWYRQLYAAVRQVTGAGLELPRELGVLTAKKDLSSGIYRVLLRVLSPEFLFSAAARIFGKYYERGTMTVEDKKKGSARGVWKDCAGFDANLWQDIMGGSEGAMMLCGAKNLNYTVVEGGGDGDEHLVADVTWD